jgi:hypothetical protein
MFMSTDKIQKEIERLERRAAESAALAAASLDEEVQIYNRSLAQQLEAEVALLRKKIASQQMEGPAETLAPTDDKRTGQSA